MEKENEHCKHSPKQQNNLQLEAADLTGQVFVVYKQCNMIYAFTSNYFTFCIKYTEEHKLSYRCVVINEERPLYFSC